MMTLQDMAIWSDDRLMFRAVLLAVMCVDRRKNHTADDATLQWADAALTEMTPLIKQRMPSMDGDHMPFTAMMFSRLAV